MPGFPMSFLPRNRDEYVAYQSDKTAVDISIDARLDTDNYEKPKDGDWTAPHITMRRQGDAERF